MWCRSTSMRRTRKASGCLAQPPMRGATVHWMHWTPTCARAVRRWCCAVVTACRPCSCWSNRPAPRRCTGTASTSRPPSHATPPSSARCASRASTRRAAMAACCSSRGISPPSRASRTRCSRRTGATCSATGACPHCRPHRRHWRRTQSTASHWMISSWHRRWIGMPDSGSTGSQAKPVRWKRCPCSRTVRCAATASSVTCQIAWAPRGCRRTCISARSRRGALPMRWKACAAPAPTPTSTAICASSAGVISPITCCITSRRRRPTTSTRALTVSRGQHRVPRNCTTGSAATPACRSSMPACVSCGTPVTCTTGCG